MVRSRNVSVSSFQHEVLSTRRVAYKHSSRLCCVVQSKLQLSMSRFFKRLPVDKPVVRNNYSLQVIARPEDADPFDPDELAWAKTMKGDEDVEEGEPGFRRPEGGNGSFDRGVVLEPAGTMPMDPATLRLRVERQTLRRLPRTGAIVFTIRVYMTPLVDLVKEPDVPGRLASAIRSWPDDVAQYVLYSENPPLSLTVPSGTRRALSSRAFFGTWTKGTQTKSNEASPQVCPPRTLRSCYNEERSHQHCACYNRDITKLRVHYAIAIESHVRKLRRYRSYCVQIPRSMWPPQSK